MKHTIIIGTGVFGLSSARHVHERFPNSKLSIISRQSNLAASDDVAKIIRVDYNNVPRMKEAVEIQKRWKEEYQQFYHPIGRIDGHRDPEAINIINRARAELSLPPRQPDSNLMKEHFGTTKISSLTYVLNSDDAIVDWGQCIARERDNTKNICSKTGGQYHESGVKRLRHKDGLITVIELENGETVDATAANVVLAVGPWFADLLKESDISPPPKQRTPIATCIFVFPLKLNHDQVKYFREKPMVSHQSTAEFLPPTRGGTSAKLTWVEPFTNMSGSTFSRVQDLSDSALAFNHMSKAINWAREFIPSLKGAEVTSIRSFWDGITETQDPIIARHPEFSNLVSAGGGSFNRAKDLPTIGKLVADVLDMKEVPDQYGWNFTAKSAHRDHPQLMATGDFTDKEKESGPKPARDKTQLTI